MACVLVYMSFWLLMKVEWIVKGIRSNTVSYFQAPTNTLCPGNIIAAWNTLTVFCFFLLFIKYLRSASCVWMV